MPEILPNLTDPNRCVSVHWSLPVQCVLPRTHADLWHEVWHTQTGNRMRYRRTMGVYVTEELHDGAWHDLAIPAPGVVCGEPHSSKPGVFCQVEHGENGNRWNHNATVNGCLYTWHTPQPRPVGTYQLGSDVRSLRAQVEELHAALTQSENDLTGARLSLWEEEQDVRRLHLALKSARRGRSQARERGAELETLASNLEGELSELREEYANTAARVSDVDRLRDFKRRVTEEVEEFQDAANDDPTTPPVALHMIKLLRMAMAETTEAGDLR